MIRFPIEEGQILQFARAIGDTNPIYADRDYAASTPFGAVLAPPTFTVAAVIFDPDFEGRPRPGHPWPPSGRGGPQAGDTFHSQQSFEYLRHPVAGEVLAVTSAPARTWQRTGRRGGVLRFNERCSEFTDAAGDVAIRSVFTSVQTEHEVDPAARSQAAPELSGPGAVLVEGLTRTQIVMYAAAAGDYHPLHHDEQLSHELGYPAIFPHGMFLMGLAGRLLTDAYGDGALRSFAARFLQPIWPGDTVLGRIQTVPDAAVTGRRVAVELFTQEDVVAMRGHAVVSKG
ncbi:MaoC/PaaZ C-terminal domain-containing protein [Dactylosporangium sp. CA-092794]|uniref:MaoC/PaaZ C-terminal domain-containing protein n=1 Tax=Dactylosporangium sp. CA-092794 TaxID=3239929 RepID=UPI003D8AF98B